MITLRKANERGRTHLGWLDSYHSFSFGEYYDPRWTGFRGLRVMNDDLVAPSAGFGTHPHRDMEIISFVLRGELEHKDSMGNGRIIRAGEFQYMAAGSGVRHSELNPSRETPVHFLQIWIVPDRRGVPPRYAEKSFSEAEDGKWHPVASASGEHGAIAIHQDAQLWLGKARAGDRLNWKLASGRFGWVQMAEGEITLNGQVLQSGDGAALEGETELEISAAKFSQILLFDLG